MKYLKALCGVGFFVVLVSNVWSISGWTEIRGVYDDICYLRQAHLFQRFGLDGLDTNISRDDDRYLAKIEGDRFPDLERYDNGSLSHIDAGNEKACHAIPAGHGLCAGAVSVRISGDSAVCFSFGRRFWFCACRNYLRVHGLFAHACSCLRRRSHLPDDQSDQGELFDGADDDGLRAPGFPDCEALC